VVNNSNNSSSSSQLMTCLITLRWSSWISTRYSSSIGDSRSGSYFSTKQVIKSAGNSKMSTECWLSSSMESSK
jgi:hypothetical protein